MRFPYADERKFSLHSHSVRIPSNLRFEVDDVSLGLEHFSGDFDVVHIRHICSGVRDYHRLIDDTALALRPNGLAEFVENDWRMYDINKLPILGTPTEIWGQEGAPDGWLGTGMARSAGGPGAPYMPRRPRPRPSMPTSPGPSPYWARFITLARQCVQKRGGNIDAPGLLQRWTEDHHGFKDIVYEDFWVPVSPWMKNEENRRHPAMRDLSDAEIATLIGQGTVYREDALVSNARFP